MSNNVRLITEVAIMTAVAFILNFLSFKAPWAFGGSISIEMLPIILVAFRHGVKGGVLAGVLFGFIQLVTATPVHPVQFLLDYPVAYGLVGLAGVLKPNLHSSTVKQASTIAMATLIGSLLRFAAHLISGAVYFASYAPEDMPVMTYNLIYNAGYMVPSFILTSIVLTLLITTAPRLLNERVA